MIKPLRSEKYQYLNFFYDGYLLMIVNFIQVWKEHGSTWLASNTYQIHSGKIITVKTLIRAAALIKFQVNLGGSYLRAAPI